ncbi:MAG TPA: cytochrome ubiquinol oxidase subunit I [Thermoanaerobaculia bacterium]|nr:cytochrome ubiquinol oxidase subunit I [Thermoanaerobaculia bacterium]
MSRKQLLGLAVVAVIALLALAKGAQVFDRRLAYQSPVEVEEAAPTPRQLALEEERLAEAEAARTKPYEEAEYRAVPRIGSRTAIWVVAQLKLLFAAFVLAVPMFALIIEFIGYRTGDRRYDRLAYEFTSLLSPAFAMTAAFGGVLTFMLIILYPKFTNYLMSVFSPTFLPYVLLLFAEAGLFYTYYYTWGKIGPRLHLTLGLMLNLVGTGLMFVANAWLTFMMTPAGISESGAVLSVWDAVANYTWMPINIHRLIANVAYGGSIAGAYAAYQFLKAKTPEERAHYDWMGYVANFVAIAGLLPLPFAGYWLASEIYAFSQTMGLTMMGGAFSWLFIIQAVLIGNLFLAANYYLWLGMGRVERQHQKRALIPVLLGLITIGFIIWATPRNPITTPGETAALGGAAHPILGFFGVMSAKNTAVNITILATFVSFILYRRSGKTPRVGWARLGNWVQIAILLLAGAIVVFLGIYGYFVEAQVRIGLSVPQVLSVLLAMLLVTVIDVLILRGAESAPTRWGNMPERSQYVLIFLAVTFTWLMGLMGYVRSGLRQHWHVYGVIRDTSPDAFTPTLGYATQVVSVTVLIFFGLIGFIFWLAGMSHRQSAEHAAAPAPGADPALAAAAGRPAGFEAAHGAEAKGTLP